VLPTSKYKKYILIEDTARNCRVLQEYPLCSDCLVVVKTECLHRDNRNWKEIHRKLAEDARI